MKTETTKIIKVTQSVKNCAGMFLAETVVKPFLDDFIDEDTLWNK